MNRILTWHFPYGDSPGAQAYYLDDDYYPLNIRIHADTAPMVSDAEFEVMRDGVNICANRAGLVRGSDGSILSNDTVTSIVLTKNESEADVADDLIDQTLEGGAWMTCTMISQGGGKNFTVQLELQPVPEELAVDEGYY